MAELSSVCFVCEGGGRTTCEGVHARHVELVPQVRKLIVLVKVLCERNIGQVDVLLPMLKKKKEES